MTQGGVHAEIKHSFFMYCDVSLKTLDQGESWLAPLPWLAGWLPWLALGWLVGLGARAGQGRPGRVRAGQGRPGRARARAGQGQSGTSMG